MVALGTAGIGMFARDNDKSSEQVGVKTVDPKEQRPQP
jgi:hypothetical protein